MCADPRGGQIKCGDGNDLEGGGGSPGRTKLLAVGLQRLAEVTATASTQEEAGVMDRGWEEARPFRESRRGTGVGKGSTHS